MLFLFVKWLHIVGAIVLVGLHVSYGVWVVRAYHRMEALPYALRTILFLDNWIAFPGVLTLLTSGSAMTVMTRTPLTTPWLLSALLLFLVLIVAQLSVYRPTLLRLTQLVDRGKTDGDAFQDAARRERNVGLAMTAVMLGIVLLMTVKPSLWT
jgi:uncharacterized membrane protein